MGIWVGLGKLLHLSMSKQSILCLSTHALTMKEQPMLLPMANSFTWTLEPIPSHLPAIVPQIPLLLSEFFFSTR